MSQALRESVAAAGGEAADNTSDDVASDSSNSAINTPANNSLHSDSCSKSNNNVNGCRSSNENSNGCSIDNISSSDQSPAHGGSPPSPFYNKVASIDQLCSESIAITSAGAPVCQVTNSNSTTNCSSNGNIINTSKSAASMGLDLSTSAAAAAAISITRQPLHHSHLLPPAPVILHSEQSTAFKNDLQLSKLNSSNVIEQALPNSAEAKSMSEDQLLIASTDGKLHQISHNKHPNNIITCNNVDHKCHSLDIGAGLTTIDTSSLTTIDTSQIVPSYACKTQAGTGKSHKVTAQATIIPPLASSIQDVPSSGVWGSKQEEGTPPTSPAQATNSSSHGRSKPFSQAMHHPPSPHAELSSSASKRKSCSPNVSIYEDSKSPYTSPTTHRNSTIKQSLNYERKSCHYKNETKSTIAVTDTKLKMDIKTHYDSSSPGNRIAPSNCDNSKAQNLSNCINSSRSSSPCSSSEGCPAVVSGAGCEVKGMLATPVSLASTDADVSPLPARLPSNSTSSKDTYDSGRLVIFQQGQCILELSHRSSGVSSSSSNGGGSSEGEGWVLVRSKTYYPPQSSCPAGHTISGASAPLHYSSCAGTSIATLPVQHGWSSSKGGAWRRKQTLPHRASASISELSFTMSSTGAIRLLRRNSLTSGRRDPFYRFYPYTSLARVSSHVKKEASESWWPRPRLQKREAGSFGMADERLSQKQRLERRMLTLAERCGGRIDVNLKIGQLFDRFSLKSPSPSNFVSPRKRYLKQLDGGHEMHSRKKVSSSSSSNSDSSKSINVGKNLCSSKVGLNTITNPGAPHSIDSILNSEKKNTESYLKTLLKPDTKSIPTRNSSHERHEVIKVEPPSDASYMRRDRNDHSRNWNSSHERRDVEERRDREQSSYSGGSSSSHSYSRHSASPPPLRGSPHHNHAYHHKHQQSHTSNSSVNKESVHTEPSYPPGYNRLAPHQLAALYPQLYDPNCLLLNGINPLAAGGMMPNPHNQIVAAAAAAAAAASYGFSHLQMMAQYSNLMNSQFNPAFGSAMAAAAAAPAINANLAAANIPAALTPALTPGAAAASLSITPLSHAVLPPTLTPGMSPGLPPTTLPSYPSLATSHDNNSSNTLNSAYSSSSRTSPYPTPSPRSPYPHSRSPYPRSRSPYSPHFRSSYPHSKSPHLRSKSPLRRPKSPHRRRSKSPQSRSKSPHFRSRSPFPSSDSASYSSYQHMLQQQQHSSRQVPKLYHHPTHQLNPSLSSSSKPSPTHQLLPHNDAALTQDMPLNLSKPK
uniref:Protein hairless-like n=1 Tax=Hirondellea gigas TaxID=1518452 RepID=A0A6A7FX95_9CRUS